MNVYFVVNLHDLNIASVPRKNPEAMRGHRITVTSVSSCKGAVKNMSSIRKRLQISVLETVQEALETEVT